MLFGELLKAFQLFIRQVDEAQGRHFEDVEPEPLDFVNVTFRS